MTLEEIYPIKNLEAKFEKAIQFDTYYMDDIERISKLEPGCLFELGASAWMHHVESHPDVDPQQLATYFEKKDPYIFRKVEEISGHSIIQEIILIRAHVKDNKLNRDICGQLLISRVHPKNIHISDVEFSNPYIPIPQKEKKYLYHEYKSLGLFRELLGNIITYGKKYNIEKITLSAASRHQISYFEGHGFNVENTEFAKQAIKMDSGIPMERSCT
ncbi:hypothetical protein [Marinagarivorans algicola]|uniref:hypothetical protein n=1 Tax=Marinagarivorans algicola TaxID=1513270 RepID=UPI0006B8F848|nr:hypothetical protein [Marinagarivorans algicola]